MVQVSIGIFEDDSIDMERRVWLYNKFGTTARAIYTMFECTFTSGWIQYTRPILEEISPVFILFWAPYVVFVNFTVMRVIAALFLKQTMAVSAVDAERVPMENMKE